ncbi:HNH endonuclease [Ammoniphilus sp. 3BR4]|uniref:HNH endonuclease n=1 Tax=Ammoniphilus sp. 3BR4 TaxID=3158265 RepID=UPI0034661428
MSIPKNISKEHIIKAIGYIDAHGVPERRESTKFDLEYNERLYPPKYVIARANVYANGEELDNSLFSGGEETNSYLTRLGFKIVANADELEREESRCIRVPDLEPVNRSREYESHSEDTRAKVIYEYLFQSMTHRWIDENIIGLDSTYSRGYQAMGILHYIGLKDKHKGIFKGVSVEEAVMILEEQDNDFELVIYYLRLLVSSGSETNNEGLESKIVGVANTNEITDTEKEQIIKSRIGQSAFKKGLLNIQKKCRLCGVTDERFLIASHIKSWSQSNNKERLDLNNGLLLCPNHDALFDKGYISFNDDGTIIVSSSLDDTLKIFLNINDGQKININPIQQQYMAWHRINVFRH